MTQQTQAKQIPNGWVEKKLIEALNYEQPVNYIVTTKILKEGKTPVLTPGKSFIKGYTNEVSGICQNLPTVIFDDFTTSSKFVTFPFKVKSSALKILKPKTDLFDLKYIFYQMQTIDMRTTTHKRYYLSEYQNLKFLFPMDKKQEVSLEKQQQIVSAIETQFTRLDEAVKNLKSVKEKLEFYRKSVLKKAFEKKEGWGERDFPDCFKSITPTNKIPKSIVLESGNLPVVDQGDGLIAGYIEDETKKQIANLPVIIFGDHTRRFKFVDFDFVAGADGTKILQINNFLDAKFAYYQCLTLVFPNKGYSRHFQYVNKTNLAYPKSISEQESIVQEIESKFSVIDKAEEIVNQSLDNAEKLRKSILKSAFEGKLVEE